jgi:SM-20-related protein
MDTQFDLLIDSYLENKVGIDKTFLHKDLSDGLQQNIINLQYDNSMIPAGIGNNETKDTEQKLRGDKIYWMDKSHDNIFEQEFLHLVENFIDHLNRTCYTGINAYEFHYAVYEEGSFYKRHKDQFKSNNNRKFSLINYLNKNWLQEDGGHLNIFRPDEVQYIIPEAQTAIFFKSDEMEHEVTKACRRRMSITGWLKQV